MAFNIQARVDFRTKKRARMGIWEAMQFLNTLVDESDPDVRRPSIVLHPADVQCLDQRFSTRTSPADSRGNSARRKARVDAGNH